MKSTQPFIDSTVTAASFRLPSLRALSLACLAGGVALISAASLHAKPVPANLGNGLEKLVESSLAIAEAQKTGAEMSGLITVNGKAYTDAAAASVASHALNDDAGRLLVRVTLDGFRSFKETRQDMRATIGSLQITAVDKNYRGVGVMNAYVDVSEVAALAKVPGVSAVILEWKPRHNGAVQQGPVVKEASPDATVGEILLKLGTAFDQGVTQHRVDQINKLYNPAATLDWQGRGMQIACLSNSYAAHTAKPVTIDVTNGDLPGSASDPAVNTTPVFVLQDDLSSSTSDDEGRGMVQITHKMAPKAALAFATADGGEVGFANNIRGLAGLAGYTVAGQTFAADVICDDVGYPDEPFFQDGIIGNGIDDVAAAGVAYFSSAANDIGTNGYDSDTRWIANGTGLTAAAGNAALAGTNIDLTGVPTALYAGGFHNFNPGGKDVAQTVNIQSAANQPPTVLQWNDPYDQTGGANYTGTLYSGGGTYVNAPVLITVPGPVTQGVTYEVAETAFQSLFDGIITVYKSDGTTVIAGPQDNGGDETVRFTAPANDTGFVVKVDHYGATSGGFNLVVRSFSGFAKPVSTSLSLLVFNATTGAYIAGSSLTTDATATNQPLQLGVTARPTGSTQVQYVIARSVVPAAGFTFPTHLRYLMPGNGVPGLGPAEYFTYNTVTTGGHAMANGCNGAAAYSVFRPSLPETFTSPGPVTIYYDKNNNRLATPEVRLQPRIAAADGANVSSNMNGYFASDDGEDPDTNGNFFGTSAAAPHAASIAALVLEAKGGRRSVTPAQMTSLLQRSTFPHDLDPNFASGSARVTGGTTGSGKVTITINSDGSPATAAGTRNLGGDDKNSFTIAYVGGSSVTSFVFNPTGSPATGGGTSGGNNGVTYSTSETTVGGTATYFENSLPGVAFLPASKAFTLNTGGNNVTGALATFTNPSNTAATQSYTMTLTIPSGNFPSSNVLHFTVGRGLARAATTGGTFGTVTPATTGVAYYAADIFGGGVSLPNGQISAGMSFSGTTADGGTFSGTINNRIGAGWATQDGYGFINAQTAVSQTVQ